MNNLFVSFKESMLRGAALADGSKKMQVNPAIASVYSRISLDSIVSRFSLVSLIWSSEV